MTITLSLSADTPFTRVMDMTVTITNDREVNQTYRLKTPTVSFDLPFHDGPGDNYRVIVQVDGYETTGTLVHADPSTHPTLNTLMIPNHAKVGFPNWAELVTRFPAAAGLVTAGVSEPDAETRYAALGKQKPLALALLMNLAAAMQDIGLGSQKSPLDFIKAVIWDDSLAQDRFFAYADPAIVSLVQAAAAEGEFAQEDNPGILHPGATLSYKQVQFDYSNVQLTFHQNDTKPFGDVVCIKIEPDMDLYKDLIPHGLLEVIPNHLTNGKTNPLAVLALRWIDAVQSNEPLFNPGYTLS